MIFSKAEDSLTNELSIISLKQYPVLFEPITYLPFQPIVNMKHIMTPVISSVSTLSAR